MNWAGISCKKKINLLVLKWTSQSTYFLQSFQAINTFCHYFLHTKIKLYFVCLGLCLDILCVYSQWWSLAIFIFFTITNLWYINLIIFLLFFQLNPSTIQNLFRQTPHRKVQLLLTKHCLLLFIMMDYFAASARNLLLTNIV